MHPDLQRYLDGELPRDALPPDLAREADEWAALLEDAEPLRNAPRAPAWLEGRIMARLPAQPQAALPRRLLAWLVQPHPVRLRPVTALAGAAALVGALMLWPRAQAPAPAPVSPRAVAASQQPAVVYVQFSLVAPGARSVEVAGDFNGWQPVRAQLRDPEGDGNWSAMIPVTAGIHKYMFVIDGRRWVSDPKAHRFVDDGFGMKNSLLSVVPPARST